MRIKDWLPVAGLAFAAFVFNTSEFIPIGLLSDIAKDFSITDQHAGILITGGCLDVSAAYADGFRC